MNHRSKVEISLSKTKLLFGIAGSMLFVALGFYLFSMLENRQTVYNNPVLIKGVAVATILFFGATGIYGIIKLLGKNIGLIIDDDGIMDNTNAASMGLVKWADINEFRTEQVMSTKFLLVFMKDPNSFIEKAGGTKQRLVKRNMKMYGTPVVITSTTLKYKFSDLEILLENRLIEQRKSM